MCEWADVDQAHLGVFGGHSDIPHPHHGLTANSTVTCGTGSDGSTSGLIRLEFDWDAS